MKKTKKDGFIFQSFGNWKSVKGYPTLKTPPGYWQWEFLRRNPKYWKDWKIFSKEESRRHESAARRDALVAFSDGYVGDLAVDNWGVSYMPDPREKEPNDPWGRYITFIDQVIVRVLGDEAWDKNFQKALGSSSFGMLHYSQYPLLFDLHQPIEDLIELARPILKERKKLLEKQKKITPPHNRFYTERFPFYLRILDARSHNPPISFREIAATLSPEVESIPEYDDKPLYEDNAKSWFKTAKEIRDYNYRFIHRSLKKPKKKKHKS